MKTIGITGNIGSGKSTVAAHISEHWNIPQIDADKLAKKVLEGNIDGLMKFGNDIVVDDKINYDQLFERVFSNPELIRQYNRWIHPLVKSEIKKELEKFPDDDLVIINAPLIFEAKVVTDYLILVDCDFGKRMNRILKTNLLVKKFVEAEKIYHRAEKLDKLQFPGETMRYYCDYVINNEGDFDSETTIEIARVMGEILWKTKGGKK
jgi:dephospho-CoA kinase